MLVPATAAERRGIQPVVKLTANGGARADVRVGQAVQFVGVIDAPPKTGSVVAAEWDSDRLSQVRRGRDVEARTARRGAKVAYVHSSRHVLRNTARRWPPRRRRRYALRQDLPSGACACSGGLRLATGGVCCVSTSINHHDPVRPFTRQARFPRRCRRSGHPCRSCGTGSVGRHAPSRGDQRHQ